MTSDEWLDAITARRMEKERIALERLKEKRRRKIEERDWLSEIETQERKNGSDAFSKGG